MKQVFEKEIDGVNYLFKRVFQGNELLYAITFTDVEKGSITFRLFRPEGENWKIAAQVLPQYVWKQEQAFINAILDNEDDVDIRGTFLS